MSGAVVMHYGTVRDLVVVFHAGDKGPELSQ